MQPAIDRRDFLKTVAATAMAATSSRPAANARMFVSLNGSLTNKKVEWPEFARLAARLGYGGVDVNLDAARNEGLDATRALFTELKITPTIANLPFRFGGDEAAYQEGLKQLDEAAGFAAGIGCRRMMAVLPPASETPKADLRKIITQRLLTIAEILHKSRVRLGLEFLGPVHFRTRLPHEFIWRMGEALELARECGTNVGLVLDAWHWHHAGATAADIEAAGASRIVHIHVSDAKAQPAEDVRDNQRLMPGEGVIDLMTFFRTLARIGYEGGVSPEPIGRVPPEMSGEDGARLRLETTLKVMKKAGVA